MTENATILTHAVLIGAGNIGSHTAHEVARLNDVQRLTIVDFDRYEEQNLVSQRIDRKSIGKPKAVALARSLKRIRPDLHVEPIVERIENVPLGRLRGVLLAALDSLQARMAVNEAAWRLDVPWIDAAVEPTSWLARVNVYRPGPDSSCMECAWGDAEYAAVDQVVPCEKIQNPKSKIQNPATNAPSSLGAIAAAMQVLEYRKMLAGDWEHVLVGKQSLFDLKSHRQYVTRYSRNPKCRFDHERWTIESLEAGPKRLSVSAGLDLPGAGVGCSLRSARGPFVRKLRCVSCEHIEATVRVSDSQDAAVCPDCGGRLFAGSFDSDDWLLRSTLNGRELKRSLHRLGFEPGDVFSVKGPEQITHYQLSLQG